MCEQSVIDITFNFIYHSQTTYIKTDQTLFIKKQKINKLNQYMFVHTATEIKEHFPAYVNLCFDRNSLLIGCQEDSILSVLFPFLIFNYYFFGLFVFLCVGSLSTGHNLLSNFLFSCYYFIVFFGQPSCAMEIVESCNPSGS